MVDEPQKYPSDFGRVIPFDKTSEIEDLSTSPFLEFFDCLFDSLPWALTGAIIGFIVALFTLSIVPAKYKVQMTISPATTNPQGDLSGMMPQGSVPVVNYMIKQMSNNSTTDFIYFEQLVTSHEVAKELAKNPIIMRTIFASEWDNKNKKWQAPSGVINSTKRFINKIIGYKNWTAPNATRLTQWLEHNLVIMPVGATPLREIRLNYHDPRFATALLKKLYDTTDNIIRQNTRTNTDAKIDYLRDRILQTPNPLHRSALTNILMEQEQIRIMVALNLPFAAQIIKQPTMSSNPVFPSPALLIPLMVIIGVAIGFLFYQFRQRWVWGI